MGTVLSRGLSHIVPRLRGKVVPQSAKRGRGPSGPQVVEKVVGKGSETRPLGVKGHGFAVGCGLLAQAGCAKGLWKKLRGFRGFKREGKPTSTLEHQHTSTLEH